MKIKTIYLLTIISITDLVCGGGIVTVILWGCYGLYKLETT